MDLGSSRVGLMGEWEGSRGGTEAAGVSELKYWVGQLARTAQPARDLASYRSC